MFSSGCNVTLTVSTGTLTNASGGVIDVNKGTNGNRNINATLLNQGAVNVIDTTTFSGSGVLLDPDAWTMTLAGTLSFASSAEFQLNGGTLAHTGTFSMSSGTFGFHDGAISGGSALVLLNSTLAFGSPTAGSGSFTPRGGSAALSGDVPFGTTLLVQGSSAGSHAVLTAATGFTNSGLIRLISIDSNYNDTLPVSAGTLTNSSSGVIDVDTGTNCLQTIYATLLNRGVVNVNYAATLGGTLNVSVVSGFTPAAGNTFTIITLCRPWAASRRSTVQSSAAGCFSIQPRPRPSSFSP